jgi:hydroxymethylbilane synthase
LLARRVDVAVHSAKDMTSTDADGLAVGAYLEREDPRDALCGAVTLRPGMRVGTASVRRRAQLLALVPELSIEPCAQHRRGCASAASAGSTRSCSPRAASTARAR